MHPEHKPENPNFEEYTALYKKMIAENLAHFDAMNEEILVLKKAAINEKNTAEEERNKIKTNAQQIAKDDYEKHFKELKNELEKKLQFDLVKKLIEANRTDEEICNWLNVQKEIVIKAKLALGFKEFRNQFARVYYSGMGRGGVIHLQLDQLILDFHWEFAGGNSLALIFIPDEKEWVLATGLNLTERMPILEFLAKEIILAQAIDHKFAIEGNVLRIY